MTGVDVARFAGLSAWLAAAMTGIGAVTLVPFFRRGGRRGTWHDASSVVLMLAMIPVALVLTIIALEVVTTTALVIGRVAYEQTRLPVLALGDGTLLVGGALAIPGWNA